MEVQSDTEDPMLDPNVTPWMDQGFHCGMTQAADRADAHFGRCFNCLEEGHRWRECKNTPLLPELQEILDREALNRKGALEAREATPPMNLRNGKGKVANPNQTRTVKSESKETPFRYWNQDALSRWLGCENLGWALVKGVRTRVLLDNGT